MQVWCTPTTTNNLTIDWSGSNCPIWRCTRGRWFWSLKISFKKISLIFRKYEPLQEDHSCDHLHQQFHQHYQHRQQQRIHQRMVLLHRHYQLKKSVYPINFIDLRILVIFDSPGWVMVQYFSCSKGGLPHRRWFWMFHWLSYSWSFSAKFLSHSHLILLHDPGGSTENELFCVQKATYSLHDIVMV